MIRGSPLCAWHAEALLGRLIKSVLDSLPIGCSLSCEALQDSGQLSLGLDDEAMLVDVDT